MTSGKNSISNKNREYLEIPKNHDIQKKAAHPEIRPQIQNHINAHIRSHMNVHSRNHIHGQVRDIISIEAIKLEIQI